MTRYCDECERYAETAFGEGECAKWTEVLKEKCGTYPTVVVLGKASADKCPYFKEMEIDDNDGQ